MMGFLCNKLGLKFGCTWVVKTDNPRISWATTKKMDSLSMENHESEPKMWLECLTCGKVEEDASPERVKSLAG